MKVKIHSVLIMLFFTVILLAACEGAKKTGPQGESGTAPPTEAPVSSEPSAVDIDSELKGEKYQNMLYRENGISVRFGILGEQNLFEPESEIPFYAEITGRELDGSEARVTFTNISLRFDREHRFILTQADGEKHTYTGSFSASLNGVYTLTLILEGDLRLSFDVGVVPKNQTASDAFLYGVQPYICRAYTWGSGYAVAGQTISESEESILNTIGWLGCNLIREDGTVWETMQPTENAPINWIHMDRLVKVTSDRGLILNWLLQSTPRWAAKEEYLSLTEPDLYWSVCPQEEKWDTFASAVAERYAKEEHIFWEIWNEPDWEFFTGTPEDYLSLLERTARIFRAVNPDLLLYPGGLTVVNDPNDFRYKDSRPYFKGFRRLLDEGLIDTYAIHIHGPFNDGFFFNTLNEMTAQAQEAGLSMSGIFNTEAGLSESNQQVHAENLMAKILYTRGHDAKMYVQYSFRAFPASPEDGWAIFDSSLQPKKAAIAYAVLIGKLGQCEKLFTLSDSRSLFADLYSDGSQSVVTVFCDGRQPPATLKLPKDRKVSAYDMYGNPIEVGDSVTPSLAPIYLVFDGILSRDSFSVD